MIHCERDKIKQTISGLKPQNADRRSKIMNLCRRISIFIIPDPRLLDALRP